MLKEKVRVYVLARELNVETKDLLDLCKQAGFDVKNQLSGLEPEQRTLIEQMLKKGVRGATAPAAPPPAAPVVPTALDNRVRVLAPVRKKDEPAPAASVVEAPPAPPAPAAPAREPEAAPPKPEPVVVPAAVVEPAPPAALPITPPQPPPPPAVPTVAPKPAAPVQQPGELAARMPDQPGVKVLPTSGSKVPTLPGARAESSSRQRQPRQLRPVISRLAAPPSLRPMAKPPEKKAEPVAQKPIARPESLRSGTMSQQDAVKEAMKVMVAPAVPVDVDDEDEDKKGKGGVRPGGVAGRDARHKKRNERALQRRDRTETDIRRGLPLDDANQPKKRLMHLRKPRPITEKRKGKVPIETPITVRALSEALGIRVGELLMKLRDHGAPPTIMINSTLDAEMAETIALDSGAELDIRKSVDPEEGLIADQEKPVDPADLRPRAPVVTIMGHVDHGKTSLLDKIRQSDIVATEAGGITQVIRAWRVEHGGRPVTFLDTPGHEAFTKMRARGAQVTDIVVIVVAADDGVMPQTEEAISHAKAAGVPVVVAINKTDLPNANLRRTEQQLYGLGLIPDTMGGETPFVQTSAATGKGIKELLDMLSLVAELKELKANPNRPAKGTCLEAMLSEGEGVQATLLVREGTIRKGDVVVCGASFGRVRAMYDDMGRPIQEAGPSVPVRIAGLDSIPNADDPFSVVPELTTARDIAEKRKFKQQEAALFHRAPISLESLAQAKVAELKIILKADFRGSIEAIRKEMEKLRHDEVRVNLLHAGIGGITESDVVLALTSPEDTIIVGFNVVPDDRARALADERGVQIREYDIIYNLTNDIRAALEGKLKPHENVVHLGRAVVRETFKISRVGTVAGCYVTQGNIERSAKIRLIRQGVVIYPPSDRTASFESLKRFKEDVREVREGFECGMKIAGYDDLKVDDVIEAYRIEQVQRTL